MFTQSFLDCVDMRGEIERQLQHLINERTGETEEGFSEFWL
jgi:hypothetical protein